MNMAHLLGINIGTIGTKTLLITDWGCIRVSVTVEYPSYAPESAWSEQVPMVWWQATVERAYRALRGAKVKRADIKGLGLPGLMHGNLLQNKPGRGLRLTIRWNNQRTGVECEEITGAASGHNLLLQLESNPAPTGFAAPKILWVSRLRASVRRLLGAPSSDGTNRWLSRTAK
jgi:xylulokinase